MRSKTGTVISSVNDKTIIVKVDREVRHPIYKKNYRVSKKFHAHDEKNEAEIGDVVSIVESKPISKQKTWKLEKILFKNAKVVDQPAAVESDSEKELKESVAKEKVEPVKVESEKEEIKENTEDTSKKEE
jgi:small subunit ribosomal protein S17